MNFKMRLGADADEYLPGLDTGDCVVELTEREIYAHMGTDFDVRAEIDAVDAVQPMVDPRPEVYLPLGVSAAVEQLGRDTLVAIGSYEGLVRIDFNRQVEGRTTAEGLTTTKEDTGEPMTVYMRHLILSLEDVDGFVSAVGKRRP